MSLNFYNKTGTAVSIKNNAGNLIVSIPVVSSAPPARSVKWDVTNEMRGLSGADYAAVQTNIVTTGMGEFQWSSGAAEYATTGLSIAVVAPTTIDGLEMTVANSAGLAPALTIRKTYAAGATGLADDITIYSANAPFAFRIIDVMLLTSTAIGGATGELRSASGGGGSALSDALSAAATDRQSDTGTAVAGVAPLVALGGSLFLRRSIDTFAGEVLISIEKV